MKQYKTFAWLLLACSLGFFASCRTVSVPVTKCPFNLRKAIRDCNLSELTLAQPIRWRKTVETHIVPLDDWRRVEKVRVAQISDTNNYMIVLGKLKNTYVLAALEYFDTGHPNAKWRIQSWFAIHVDHTEEDGERYGTRTYDAMPTSQEISQFLDYVSWNSIEKTIIVDEGSEEPTMHLNRISKPPLRSGSEND